LRLSANQNIVLSLFYRVHSFITDSPS